MWFLHLQWIVEKKLIKNLQHITSVINILQSRYFVGNVDCRYCWRYYENEIWIGLIFNNILFSAAYQLTLAVKDKDGIIAQKLSNTNINFLSHFFPSEENKGHGYL